MAQGPNCKDQDLILQARQLTRSCPSPAERYPQQCHYEFRNIREPGRYTMLHLTTIGRVTGRAREIEIWFIFHHEKFYVFSEHREAAGWVITILCSYQ